jgi:hypothetical protein
VTRDSDESALPTEPAEGPPSLADDSLLAPFRETDDPVLTTEEIGDSVPFRRVPTVEGLERLASEGVLERKEVSEGTVWWLPGHTETEQRRGPMPGATREYEGGLPLSLENEISTLSAPNERERAATYAVCHYLAERGSTSAEALRDEVHPDHAAGYEDADSWWHECIRPALSALTGVERAEGSWRLAPE